MKIPRRVFLSLPAISSLALVFTGSAAHKPAAGEHYLAFVGTYTEKTNSKGIYAFDFDSATGKLTERGVAAESPNPSWVTVHPNGKYVYAANEGGKKSAITAFSVDAKTGKLTQLNQVSALGNDPCHLSLDKSGKYLFAANYSSGNVVVFPILADGKLGEHTAAVKDAGATGPNKERQEGPHAHWVQPSPDNHFVFVSDLGLDAILSYRFDVAKGTLTSNDPPLTKVAPGAGPRHAAFSPDGKFFYVVSELNSTVTAFSYDATKGTFHELQALSTLPQGFHGRNDDAEITVHPTGKWVFASNRGHDTIAVFKVDPATGKLTAAGEYPTGGKEPRHFTLDPSGNFLLAENQNTDSVAVFRIDLATGTLTQVSKADVASPVCLAFYPTH
jgi:6-phosphogluconolactonase